MELRQLRYFVEVAQREHISDAAEHLHVAQSAISRQISNLEDELGTPLFERIGRNVKLTPIGKTFLVHTIDALKAIDFAAKQVEEFLDPAKGTIKIGFPTSLASYVLPSVITAFKKQFPDVSFHLRQGSYKYLIDAVKNRELNLAFLGPLPPKDELINTTLLFSESIHALLHAVHEALHILHPTLSFHLFLTLSFLALPVIPSLKLTDTGLFDVEAFEHIDIEVKLMKENS